jgi:hypothetical protein
LFSQIPGNAKADVDVSVLLSCGLAIGGSNVGRPIAESSASQDATLALTSFDGCVVERSSRIALVPAVLDLFGDVAMNLE